MNLFLAGVGIVLLFECLHAVGLVRAAKAELEQLRHTH